MVRENSIKELLMIVKEAIIDESRLVTLLLTPVFSMIIAYELGFDQIQIIAISAFTISVLGTFLYWKYKLLLALISVTALLMLGVMDIETLIESAEFDIILFLFAMTIIVVPLKRAGFFRWLTILLLKWSNFKFQRLIIFFILTSTVLAALMGSVTSIVLISIMIMEFCDYFKLDPTLPLISAILATNIGSSATALGNPVGLILALGAGLGFEEFIRWSMPPAILSIIFISWFFSKVYRHEIEEMNNKMEKILKEREIKLLDIWATIEDIKKFFAASITFTITLLAIAFHTVIEKFLHLKGETMLVGIAFLGAAASLYLYREEGKEIISSEVDWWSLLFIAFLFGQTGALKYTGVTEKIAELIISFSGGELTILLAIISISVFVLSAFLDNVPTVATFIPIVLSLAEKGVEVYPFWWIVLISGCYAGNLTPLASAANIIALGLLEKKKIKITLKQWIKIGAIPTILTFILALAIILVQFYVI